MKLIEFIKYRDNCPLCNSKLPIGFISNKYRKVSIEQDKLLIDININTLSHKDIGMNMRYVLNINDNSFYIEDLDKDKNIKNEINVNVCKKFKQYHNNMIFKSLYKDCKCRCYGYETNLNLDLNKNIIESINVEYEYFDLIDYLDKDIYFSNYYSENYSSLIYYNTINEKNNKIAFKLPIIKFLSKENLIKRINNLLVFA